MWGGGLTAGQLTTDPVATPATDEWRLPTAAMVDDSDGSERWFFDAGCYLVDPFSTKAASEEHLGC